MLAACGVAGAGRRTIAAVASAISSPATNSYAIDPAAYFDEWNHQITLLPFVQNAAITLTTPLPSPVPPSPDTSRALVEAFSERGIELLTNVRVTAVDAERKIAVLDDGRELACDFFLGVPKQRAPDVVVASGMTENGWVTVDPRTLTTRFEGVYAVGDLANTGAPKAGVFAEGAARAVAKNVIAKFLGSDETAKNPGAGSCYIEFGAGRIARVDVDFFSGPKPTGTFQEPSPALRAEKQLFGASRRARWFGMNG